MSEEKTKSLDQTKLYFAGTTLSEAERELQSFGRNHLNHFIYTLKIGNAYFYYTSATQITPRLGLYDLYPRE